MSTRKPTTQIDRFIAFLRSWIRRAADNRDTDRRSADTSDTPVGGTSTGALATMPVAERTRPEPDRHDRSEAPDADTGRQDEHTAPTGASVDEFDEGTAPTEHPDLADVEEAAEPDTDSVPAGDEAPSDARDTPVRSSGDADDISDGTLAAERLPVDDAITEADQPTDEALAAADAADLDAAETAAANAFADDEDLGSTPALLDADDAPTDDTVLPDDVEDVADLTGPPVDRSGFPDLSMDGDTDYEVAGYPSDHMDGEERSDPDDAGLYERETMEAEADDAADASDEVGTLGLADSETIAAADSSTDAASPMPIDTRDIGVGGLSEVDDTSMLTTADLATDVDAVRGDPDLADAADEHGEEDWLAPTDAPTAGIASQAAAPTTDDLNAAPTDLDVDDSSTASAAETLNGLDEAGGETIDDATSRDAVVENDLNRPEPPPDASPDDFEGETSADPFGADPTGASLPDPSNAADVDALEAPAAAGDAPLDEIMATDGEAEATGGGDQERLPPSDVASEPDAAGTMAIPTGGGAPEGRVRGDASGVCPTGYPVKGNASSKIYHLPDSASYAGTKAEWCFASEQEAITAGYRAPGKRNQGGGRRRR